MDDMCECDESCGIHGAVIRQRVALEMHACMCQKTLRVFPNCSHADCATTPRHVPKSMFQNSSRGVYTEIVHSTQYRSWRLRASGLPVMSQPPLFFPVHTFMSLAWQCPWIQTANTLTQCTLWNMSAHACKPFFVFLWHQAKQSTTRSLW